MAKKLTEFKNPLTNSGGSIFDLSLWLGGILWVVMFGMIFAIPPFVYITMLLFHELYHTEFNSCQALFCIKKERQAAQILDKLDVS